MWFKHLAHRLSAWLRARITVRVVIEVPMHQNDARCGGGAGAGRPVEAPHVTGPIAGAPAVAAPTKRIPEKNSVASADELVDRAWRLIGSVRPTWASQGEQWQEMARQWAHDYTARQFERRYIRTTDPAPPELNAHIRALYGRPRCPWSGCRLEDLHDGPCDSPGNPRQTRQDAPRTHADPANHPIIHANRL